MATTNRELWFLTPKGPRETLPAPEDSKLVPGELVRIEGHGQEYVVLRVDHERHLADLAPPGSVTKVEAGIPLVLLKRVKKPGLLGEMKLTA